MSVVGYAGSRCGLCVDLLLQEFFKREQFRGDALANIGSTLNKHFQQPPRAGAFTRFQGRGIEAFRRIFFVQLRQQVHIKLIAALHRGGASYAQLPVNDARTQGLFQIERRLDLSPGFEQVSFGSIDSGQTMERDGLIVPVADGSESAERQIEGGALGPREPGSFLARL